MMNIDILETKTIGNCVFTLTRHSHVDGLNRFRITWSSLKNNLSKSFTFYNEDKAFFLYDSLVNSNKTITKCDKLD